jgi:cell division protein FtsN
MLKQNITFLLLLVFSITAFAGNDNDSIPKEEEPPKEIIYGPTVGLGIGMFKFYGDILDANYGNPLISNIGYDLHVKQRINPFFITKFYVLFGTLSANERSENRNLNFRSSITVGGFALEYNFDQLLPKKRIINPYISLGIESVEFLSKTDLYDEYGNKYNYWSDGSIRNLPENDPNAAQSIVIQRDYFYETDLRELNYDGQGKYSERTFSIPLGIGAIMHLTDNIDFTIGTSLHFTFTDLIDNVIEESGDEHISNQPGNKGNDKFLMSSFSISYNFLKDKKQEEIKDFDEEEIDYLAYDTEDEDSDGVIDFIDECPWTPAGVEVDEHGCPLDKDKDFVPNYKDDELETRENAPVSPNGVELTDTMIYIAYQKYMDSTGVFADVETRIIAAEKRKKKKKYKVQVGAFTEAIDADLVDKFLSIPDVEIKSFGDSLTVIAVGEYNNLPDAIKRKVQLTSEGFDAAIVVEQEKDGTLKSVGDEANNMAIDNDGNNSINSQGLIFRVQLGAFSKRQPKSAYNGLGNIMEIKADDGLYKYLYTESFKTVEDAASKKLDLAIDYGVNDAFIVAYKDGKRISLKEAGVNTSAKENDIKTNDKNYDKTAIKFKVQIGSYKNQLPIEVLSKFMEIEGVDQTEIDGGLTRYTAGEFDSYKEAQDFKDEIVAKGIGGAFVIALHKDELIPVTKARELVGQE